MTALDARDLRDAFGRFMTGVTIVTAHDADGTPKGFTANSFASVSLDPPLLLVCPGRFLSSFDTFASCDTFAVSVLAEGQEAASNTFATSGGDRFGSVPHVFDGNGNALIEGAVATFSCKTHQRVEAGDHIILIGQVVDFKSDDLPGLGYRSGQYFSLGLERAAHAASGLTRVCGIIIQALDTVLLERTPQGYRPPQFALRDNEDLVKSVRHYLARQGVDADIGPVYSVFDDPAQATHYAYLLAQAHIPMQSGDNSFHNVPIKELPKQEYATPALADMMTRFAQEAETGSFTLYVGDAERGITHSSVG